SGSRRLITIVSRWKVALTFADSAALFAAGLGERNHPASAAAVTRHRNSKMIRPARRPPRPGTESVEEDGGIACSSATERAGAIAVPQDLCRARRACRDSRLKLIEQHEVAAACKPRHRCRLTSPDRALAQLRGRSLDRTNLRRSGADASRSTDRK